MKFSYWLGRQGETYSSIIKKNNISNYEELCAYAKRLGLNPPENKDVEFLFAPKPIEVQKPKINTKPKAQRKRTTRKSTRKSKNEKTSTSQE